MIRGGAVMNWNYDELAATLRAEMSSHPPIVVLEKGHVTDMDKNKMWCIGNGQADQLRMSEKVGALNCMHDQQAFLMGDEMKTIIRRITPTEAERLQGYPDGYTDIGEWVDSKGKKHKEADSPRYKALGNSICLPFWFYLLRRISAQYERPATLGSLFDGIGGFPLCWERCNGKGTARWASEIEEFPIAVTKKHFPEPE